MNPSTSPTTTLGDDWRTDPLLRNVSKRIVQHILRYLDDNYGPKITDAILQEIGHDRDFFDDVTGFMPLETTETMFKAAIRLTGDIDFAYHIGKSLWKYTPVIQALIGTTVATPALLFENMGKIEGRAVRTTIVETRKLSTRKYRLRVSFRGGFVEPHNACRNRQGTYESVPEIFGLPPAKVEHPFCRFRGDEQCVYDVTIPAYGFFAFQKASFVIGASALAMIGFAVVTHSSVATMIGAFALPASLGSYLVFLRLRLKSYIRWTQTAQRSVEENNRVLKNEMDRTRCLHNLTSRLNRCLTVDTVALAAARALVEDFGYGSSQVWTIRDSDTLYCAAVHGLSFEMGEAVRTQTYSISEGLKRPDSFVASVLGRKETLLINDIQPAIHNFITRTKNMVSQLNPSAIIIIPLTENQKAIGMLIGLHHDQGKKVKYLDRLLFEALTLVVSNSLAKALLYESMERKLEKRKAVLKERQEELLTARQMSIQSEKLSALGEMAAGIAHEINNPLNFLVNIVGELESDVEGLRTIRTIAQAKLGGDSRRELETLEREYELQDRLSEMNYVFSLLKQSLEKAQKTVSSLKAFARSSGTAETKDESVRDLIQKSFEVIPHKYRQEVRLECNVEPTASIKVNAIEFSQVIMSLMLNAIEAMDGKGCITARLEELQREYRIRIQDTGPGVPADILPMIFRPFFTTKSRNHHIGLGLIIAREVVRKYGGEISVDQQQGRGACFLVSVRKHISSAAS